jgi:cytochrome c peroxidase
MTLPLLKKTALLATCSAALALCLPREPGAALNAVAVGELAFNDRTLSAGGNLACASCHTAATGHADPAGTFMPMGGAALDQQGHRSSPSLSYLASNRAFGFNPQGQPRGGFFWDGRANSLFQQAGGPLLNGKEMANASLDAVADKVRAAPYYRDLLALYSRARAPSSAEVVNFLQQAIAAYQFGDPDYALFNSKFDRFQDGNATLTAAEARGLALFNDPQKGNCASCHISATGAGGERPLFTDFSYHALGLPRNTRIQANADANYYDMGLCGPDRSDLALRVDLCGAFKVPTLRNIALTAPYFHNGASATLIDAVSFYATRDVDPRRWYPLLNGQPDKFNDLPLGYRGNVVLTPPFGLLPGNRPRLNAQETSDIVAFLLTLTDDTTAPPRGPVVGSAAGPVAARPALDAAARAAR